MSEDAILVRSFGSIDLNDPFFDSLKSSYKEFVQWFQSKHDETAYVSYDNQNHIQAFLYIKKEDGPVSDIIPPLNTPCLKVGTFKIIPHGTKLGERFVKIITDTTLALGLRVAYVTIFKKHEPLIRILEEYGFKKYGNKTTQNGTEDVYVKNIGLLTGNRGLDYPIVDCRGKQKWLMSVRPEYHTKLFPDSKLKTERNTFIQDTSYTNSIHKVYVGCYRDFDLVEPGDCIVIYRCQSPGSTDSAWFKSVATSLCVVEEKKRAIEFPNEKEFISYCEKYSVLGSEDLSGFYKRNGAYSIKMTYNLAFPKRPNMEKMVENMIIPSPSKKPSPYYGMYKLSDSGFQKIVELGGVYEGFVIH